MYKQLRSPEYSDTLHSFFLPHSLVQSKHLLPSSASRQITLTQTASSRRNPRSTKTPQNKPHLAKPYPCTTRPPSLRNSPTLPMPTSKSPSHGPPHKLLLISVVLPCIDQKIPPSTSTTILPILILLPRLPQQHALAY